MSGALNRDTLRDAPDFGVRPAHHCPFCRQRMPVERSRGKLLLIMPAMNLFWGNEPEPRVTLTETEGYCMEILMRQGQARAENFMSVLRPGTAVRTARRHMRTIRDKLADAFGSLVTLQSARWRGYWLIVQNECQLEAV